MSTTPNITVTEIAQQRFRSALDSSDSSDHSIRVTVERKTPTNLDYVLDVVTPDTKKATDLELLAGDVTLWMDGASAELLDGATIDYLVDGLHGEGFKFDNPNTRKVWSDPIATRFQDLLDDEINPGIASHGGEITLMEYKDGKAYVSMGGGCQGCGSASATLTQGIEARVKELIPEISEIIDTTDHSAGTNPYY